ncbi:MAG: ABC transporter ATP-binding protein [Bryobacteraceae bacterium]
MNGGQQAAIRFEGVSKPFNPGPLLKNVSFEVPQGEGFCILGRSGTGKTKLLKLILGLQKPDRGKIFVNGEEITALDNASLLRMRQTVGFVFQHAALFDSISVADNVAFSLRRHSGKTEDEIREMVRQKLAQVGVEKYGDAMPEYLSPGVRKRVGFARALALDPRILLIDDPADGIGYSTAREINSLLLDLKRNRKTTLLIVSNGVEEARRISDRFAVLEDGQIIFSGSADELERSDKGFLRQFASSEEL